MLRTIALMTFSSSDILEHSELTRSCHRSKKARSSELDHKDCCQVITASLSDKDPSLSDKGDNEHESKVSAHCLATDQVTETSRGHWELRTALGGRCCAG